MEKVIIVPTNKKNVFGLLIMKLFGLKENGHYVFSYSSGYYKETSQSFYHTSFIHAGRYFSDYEGEDITTELPTINPILAKYNGCDLTGINNHYSLYNLIYWLREKPETYFEIMDKIGFSLSRIKSDFEKVSKFSNYYLVQYFIELYKEDKSDVPTFLQEIKNVFGYTPNYTASPTIIGDISCLLNLEWNAIPFKFMSDEQKGKANVGVYLNMLKANPSSSYDYKLKERKANPVF